MQSLLKTYLLALVFGLSAAAFAAQPNSVIGVFTEVPAGSKELGKQITFTGLDSAQATSVWSDGSDYKYGKLVSNDGLMVLQLVSRLWRDRHCLFEFPAQKILACLSERDFNVGCQGAERG